MAHNLKSYPSTRRPPNIALRASESPTKRRRPERGDSASSSEEVIDWPASDEDRRLLGKKASSSTIKAQEAELWDLVEGRTSPPAKKLKRGGSAAAFTFGNTTPRRDQARPVTPPTTVQRLAETPQTPVTPSTGGAAAGPDPLSLLEALSAAVTPLKASLERHERLLKAAQKARDVKDKLARDRLVEVAGLKAEIDRLQARVRMLEAERS